MIPFDDNEEIIIELRRHWFSILNYVVILFLAAIAPAIAGVFLVRFFEIVMTQQLLILSLFLWSIWLIGAWVMLFIEWTDFYLDMWIVTNKRVIDINQKGLFNREMATVRIEHIQDVKIEVSGIIPTFLQLGNIHLQTAGEIREFSLDSAYKPEIAKQVINRLIDEKSDETRMVSVEKRVDETADIS
jgi:uncharacterized membrane protein YdbT with pleckstrin-like domain